MGAQVCRKYGAEGFHLFSLDAMAGGHAHTRNLSPLARAEEEPASASANACLAAYLHYHRILPIDSGETVRLGFPRLLGAQGSAWHVTES